MSTLDSLTSRSGRGEVLSLLIRCCLRLDDCLQWWSLFLQTAARWKDGHGWSTETKEGHTGGSITAARPAMSNTSTRLFTQLFNNTYHKREGLGWDCFVVGVNAVPHTHLHLSLLHPVTCGIVQPTHNPEKEKHRKWRDELDYRRYPKLFVHGSQLSSSPYLLDNEQAVSDERSLAEQRPKEGKKRESENSTV